jgi:YVTN family beta-propeller protein
VLATADGKLLDTLEAGHTAGAPVLGPDGRTLYVCNRFDHDVSVIDLVSRKERTRVRVRREPTAAALTSDGRFLLVANHLHDGRADANHMAAVLSVMDTAQARVVKELVLPDGSGVLQDLRISPDGRYAVVSHLLGRYPLPTTELERGWMNTNAKTLVDVERLEVVNTILLDSVDRGAANPWGVGWSADTAHLVVAHAGTHELSVIDFAGVLARLKGLPAVTPATGASIQAPYLGPDRPVDVVRQGEAYFHDAALWFQGWQSCASCHPGEGRVDALDWDLLNDGVGNPKNNRSLLLSHRAPPAMSMNIRETADSAIRAGLEHVLFTVQPDSVAVAMGEYLKALTPVSVGNGTWDVKVILGETPVHRDGSALFQVPARMPAYVQAIDSQGFAVKTMRS